MDMWKAPPPTSPESRMLPQPPKLAGHIWYIIHDVYMNKPGTNTKAWQTISMAPYGRGGAGFSVLDITNPNRPKHLYLILNDRTSGKVYRSDTTGNIEEYEY